MIISRSGCYLKNIKWKDKDLGIIQAIRLEDNVIREYHISEIVADGGFQEIERTLEKK